MRSPYETRPGRMLMERGVFRFGLLENRDVRISVFPEGEEILVGSAGFRGVARERGGADW
jgi:hypothetical protein